MFSEITPEQMGQLENKPTFDNLVAVFKNTYKERELDVDYWQNICKKLYLDNPDRPRQLFQNDRCWQVELLNNTKFGNHESLGEQSVTLGRILLEAGIALTSAKDPREYRTGFALLRYEPSFDIQSLNLSEESREMEQRQKSCLSEEVAVGISMHLVRTFLGCRHTTDFSSARGKFVELKEANGKRPDYCCLNSEDKIVCIESKGTTQSESVLANKISEGKKQIGNTKPQTIQFAENHYVIGSLFGIEGSQQQTVTKIDDPSIEGEPAPADNPLYEFIKLSYAKAFRYANRDDLADALITGNHLAEKANAEYQPIGFDPFGNLLLLEMKVFECLNGNNTGEKALEELNKALDELEWKKDEEKVEGKIVLPNGIALLPRLDI
jgi:hypothetical protein